MTARWLCAQGWHQWRFTHMTPARLIDTGSNVHALCTIRERCRRCGLTRTLSDVPIPRRVKT